MPAAIELIDGASLEAVARYLQVRSLAPEGTAAILLVEVDGVPGVGRRRSDARRARAAWRRARPKCCAPATTAERQELWRVRRELSLSLKMVAGLKFNHDVVVPKARIPALFALVQRIAAEHRLRIPCFGHAGDGNIHVNIMVDPADADEIQRAHEAERVLFEGVVALEGSISGEHGIGFAKAPFICDRALARRDRAHEAGQGRLRSARPPQSREDLSMTRLLIGLALFSAIATAPVAQPPPKPVRVVIQTEAGDIDAEIDIARAPITAANFLKYVDAGLFDGGRFFRTVRPENQVDKPVKIAVIQASGSRERRGEFFPAIPLERTNVTGLSHKDGTLSMARSTPDTARDSFSICVGDQPSLDFGGARQPDGRASPRLDRSSAAWRSSGRFRHRPPTAKR